MYLAIVSQPAFTIILYCVSYTQYYLSFIYTRDKKMEKLEEKGICKPHFVLISDFAHKMLS